MYPDVMYRNNVENKNENYGPFYGMKCRHDMYLEEPASTTKEGDEISRSLKMFAMITAYKTEPSQSQDQVDAIMEEFAGNGFSCDELKYQNRNNELTNFSDINFRGNLWKMLPSHAADYKRKPQPKRYNNNGIKNDNYVSVANSIQNVPSSKYVRVPRQSPVKHCVFCENNKEPDDVVKSHAVRDALGRVLCPKLRTYTCPICKASGDMAHTVKYCPQKPIITMEDASKAETFRLAKSAYFKQQMKI